MATISRLAAALALLLSLLAPSMVCGLPFSHLTASERACCRNMRGQCAGMNMPASHSCCRQNLGAIHIDAAQLKPASFYPAISLPAVLPRSPLSQLPALAGHRIAPPADSPPIPAAPAIAVLRI